MPKTYTERAGERITLDYPVPVTRLPNARTGERPMDQVAAARLHEFHPALPPHEQWMHGRRRAPGASVPTAPKAARRRAPKAPAALTGEARIEAARNRQKKIDIVRGKAEKLATLTELIYNDAEPDVFEHHLNRMNLADDPAMKELLRPENHTTPQKLLKAIDRVGRKLKLEPIRGTKTVRVRNQHGEFDVDRAPFNRDLHTLIGDEGNVPVGTEIDIAQPGYFADIDGERLRLFRAKVMTAVDEVVPPAPKRARAPKAQGVKSPITGGADAHARSSELSGRQGGHVSRSFRGGELNAGVELVEYPDGSRAVRKKIRDIEPGEIGEFGIPAKQQMDADILAGLVGAQLGVTAPIAVQDGDDAVLMDFMDGKTAIESGQDAVMSHVQADDSDADMVALFDTIIDNQDRHRGNWLIGADGKTQLIDHSLSFLYGGTPEKPPLSGSDFNELIYNVQGWMRPSEFHTFSFSQADMREIRKRLLALKPDFEARGRGDWHALMMRRLKAMTPYATGTERKIK